MTVRLAAHALNGDATALTDVRALFAHKIEHMTGERSDERIALWKRAAEIAEGNRT